MPDNAELRSAGRALIGAAFGVLTEFHVIPASVYDPFVAVGRDYEGASVMGLHEYGALESMLETAYPDRFAKPLERGHGQFASTYIFSLLEASIARCGSRGDEFDVTSQAVEDSLDELLTVLGTPTYDVACCRQVCHLTTKTGGEVQLGDVGVLPEPGGFGGLTDRIQKEIPGAARAWNRQDPRPYDPPHALLIVRKTTDDPDHYNVSGQLSRQLDHFLLVARLLTAGTVQSNYEVAGTSTLVSGMNPVIAAFGKGSFDQLIRRTVRLSEKDGPAFEALSGLIDSAEVPQAGMVTTSFGIAFNKFSGAFKSVWYENLVDLATAFEGIFIGDSKETEGLTLRLRSRAAALLATSEDSARSIFDDVAKLYDLRSRIVHGGQIRLSDLRKVIAKISTVQPGTADNALGVALGQAVDRMRDLVRRAILARLCLADKPDALWPFIGQTPVDAILADDQQRAVWRTRWHAKLDDLGVGYAAELPHSAVSFLSRDDL